MSDDWQEMDSAPLNDPVLICTANCDITTAVREEHDDPERKGKSVSVWFLYPKHYGSGGWGGLAGAPTPKMWQAAPIPPKHLYERKLTADLLEKQVAELRK